MSICFSKGLRTPLFSAVVVAASAFFSGFGSAASGLDTLVTFENKNCGSIVARPCLYAVGGKIGKLLLRFNLLSAKYQNVPGGAPEHWLY